MAIDFTKYGTPPTAQDPGSPYGAPVSPTATPQQAPASPDTLGAITNVVNSVFPGKQVGESIGTLGGYGLAALTDFYNHLHGNQTTYAKNFDTSAPTPTQTAGDIAKGAALVGSLVAPTPATFAGAVGQSAALGATASGGQAASQGAAPQDIAKTAALGGAVGGATGGAVFGFGRMISALGDKITNSVIKPTQADIRDGFSIDTLKQYGIGGSLTKMYNQTETKLNSLSTELNNKLAASPNKVNLHDVFQQTAEGLAQNKAKGFGSNTSIQGALEQLQNEIVTLDKADVSIPEAQLIKQASGKMGAWQFGAQDPAATAREKVYNAFYSNLKTAIEKNSPEGVRSVNKQISDLIPVQNAIIRRIPVAERNNALSLTDMIGLVGSALNPKALALLGLSVAQKSGTVGDLLSRFVGRSAQNVAVPLGTAAGAISQTALPEVGNTTMQDQ